MRNKGMLILLFLCTALLLLVGYYQKANEVKEVNQAKEEGLRHSLPLLSSIGQRVVLPDSPLRLVLKWQGKVSNDGSVEAKSTAEKLSATLGLGSVIRDENDGHTVYRSSAALDANTQTSLFWSELNEETSYVIVTLETSDLNKAPKLDTELQTAAEHAGEAMTKFGIEAEWNASIQGIAIEQGEPKTALIRLELSMIELLPGMVAAETYEDKTTYSRSYTVPDLGLSVSSGNHLIAMQAAIHRSDMDNRNRITVGFPLITIEY